MTSEPEDTAKLCAFKIMRYLISVRMATPVEANFTEDIAEIIRKEYPMPEYEYPEPEKNDDE